ncbi:MAG: HAD-IC family P-type ATPase, partial [Phenylobacterium sp.]
RDGAGALRARSGFRRLAELGVLASAQQPTDPVEAAFHALLEASPPADGAPAHPAEGRTLLRHYPLDPSLLAMTHVWSEGVEGPARRVAAKGAPEAIAALCRLAGPQAEAVRTAVEDMAGRGLRVLGVAEAAWEGDDLPGSHQGFAFTFRGLVGLADPLRASVPDAVRQCREAGVRVLMVTGDHPRTARAIALQAGIDPVEVLTGEEMERMDAAGLRGRVRTAGVCARILPEQKLRLVQALRSAGEVVAMTGDGVNDAPALRAADIGVAMGGRGADVAREAAALVLLDDDFGAIASAIRTGRRIWDNLRKAMGFIIAAHIPIAGLALLPLLTGMPLLLGPFHIAVLEMIIDPVCARILPEQKLRLVQALRS